MKFFLQAPVLTGFAIIGIAASPAFAVRTYQVTGPVLELTDSKIVVQKGKEKWELDRTPATKVNLGTGGELKVGSKVTVEYSMAAQTVEVKADKKKK